MSFVVPLQTRKNLVLFVVLGWGVGAFSVDCGLRERIDAVSLQTDELVRYAVSHCCTITCGNTEMEVTVLLCLCSGHHENYSLGLICILKLPVKWSHGRSSICSTHARESEGRR